MNRYSHYTSEITKHELFDGLVGCGLFAQKIPSFFCSKQFLEYIKTISLPIDEKEKDYVRYFNMRNINIPRPLAIPTPFAYSNLCNTLKINWDKIQQHFKDKTINDKHKISQIHLRKLKDKCGLFEMNYKNYKKDGFPEQEHLIKSKYVAHADIAKCFPSIYSHSIPWAILGKDVAKSKRGKTEWFNILDFHIRNLKYGETNGLLIGPHASNLISEIVLTAVDNEMTKKGFKYIRHIDDYKCYTKSYEEAEKFMLNLSIELRKYELSLNEKKSEIIPLPKASVKRWVNQLNNYIFKNSYKVGTKEAVTTKDLKAFLDFSVELMLNEKSDASILNYAIKIISKKHLGIGAKKFYINQIHHLILLYPYLASILETQVFEPHNISKKSIKNIADDIYEYGIERTIYEACSYGLYWAVKYDFKLKYRTTKKKSIESEDCVFLTSSYIYNRKYFAKADLKEFVDLAKKYKKLDFNRYWLFVYEVLPWSQQFPNYKEMRKKKISFIKKQYLYK